jgi:hypothetical protein
MDDKFQPIDPNSQLGQMMEKFKNFDVSKITPVYPTMDYDFINRQVQEIEIDPIIPEGYFEKSQEYQQQSLEMLKSINQNTANLYTLVDLISKSNEQQDEVIGIVSEILAIAKAKEKKEAESLLKKVMTKINDSVETADSMIKLVGWATTIYNMVITMLPQ